MSEPTNIDEEILESNKEIADEISSVFSENIKIYSRDWTVETIYNQIIQGNIELNPKFQRRNAWNDEKRSRLIESLILKLPVPEIVLAESHEEKNKFVVLDGKQRLLTIAGFLNHETYRYWDKPVLRDLKLRSDLNGFTAEQFSLEANKDVARSFFNSDIRCTVVFNQSTDDILYEIFYRLNSGAVPLSMQELRQSLRKGHFSDYLMECTEQTGEIHRVLGLTQPDKRLIDAEIVLKFISYRLNISQYRGNLKSFLDDTLVSLNKTWQERSEEINDLFISFNKGINRLEAIFEIDSIGRYFNEKRFNRNLFDVEAFYFSQLDDGDINPKNNTKFIEGYKVLSEAGSEFRQTLTSSTNTKKNVANRFDIFRNLINSSYDKEFPRVLEIE